MKIRNAILGAGLSVAAAGAAALSLGASRGSVVLGLPVDLSFDVQPDPGIDVASSCVAAKVVAGEAAVSDAKVRVMPLPDMRGRPPAIRVQTSVAVDEPVLTVTISAGCTGKVTRTYTFLAELPTVAQRSASPIEISRLPSTGVAGSLAGRAEQNTAGASGAAAAPLSAAAVQAPPSPASPRRDGAASVRSAGASVPRAAAASPAQPRATRPPAAPRAAKTVAPEARTSGRARLVVEPLDLWMDRPLALRSSPELLTAPSEEPSAQRAQAAALWKALNAQPDDVQSDEDRLKALEADVAQLRSQAARDQAKAAQLQQQLAQAENERLPATWFYAMAGLLLLALLFAAWAWSRMRSASEKAVRAWRDSVAALGGREALAQHEATLGLVPHPHDAWTSTDAAADATLPGATGASMPRFVPTTPTPSAPAPLEAAAPAAAEPLQTMAPPPGPPAPVPVPASAMHIVSPEELFDIQQQAEFFISVGEHQQAIEVLRKHIAERGDTSPLAYLELLRLYHSLSRAEEFAQLRTQFMQSFNAQVPEFAGFHRTGRMLYHYTDALAAIEAEWSSPSVLLLLEKMMFKHGGASMVEPFDLAAYDDLLLLLAIAQTTPASARGAPPPRERTTPSAAPREETLAAHHVHHAVPAPASDLRLSTANASLDFEFDEMFPPANVPAPEAEAPSAAPREAFDTRGAPLDLDLSDPPHLTLNDLPPVPVTAPPAPGQAVGFGLENDRVELRLELEQKKTAGS